MPLLAHKLLKRETLFADLSAGIVVFLVALPLCLGIATASGAPALSGVIAGIVGGVVVGLASGSQLSVSGPAAGLTVIVLNAIEKLGDFRHFLLAVVLAGLMQLALGLAGAGILAHFFPSSVIKGMLAAIGLILILKQIPHAFGYDKDFEGDFGYVQPDGHTTFSELFFAFEALSPAAIVISAISVTILLAWRDYGKVRLTRVAPAPLMVVAAGIACASWFDQIFPDFALNTEHYVTLPVFRSPSDILDSVAFPKFEHIGSPAVWRVAVTIAIVASIETLLSIEAVDRLDPYRRITPTNRELRAQGIGNAVSGLIGGLPLTAVIVRSSANIAAGGRTKVSALVHGVLLLVSLIALGPLLNRIPLASLAVVLIFVGFKLTTPSLYKEMARKGVMQWVPFAITIGAVLTTDLLVGTLIGLAVGILFVIRESFRTSILVTRDDNKFLLRLTRDVSFLNKAYLKSCLSDIPDGSYVLIDVSRARFLDEDTSEVIRDFNASAPSRGVTVELKYAKHQHGSPLIPMESRAA